MNYKQRHSKLEDRNFIHILPKANEIVQVDLQNKKSIYPFKMIYHKNSSSLKDSQTQQYNAPFDGIKFQPPKQTVLAHFTKQLLIYDKFNNNEDDFLFNTNIFSIEKLKNLRNHDYVLSLQETKAFVKPDKLTFDSRFESGNLSFVSKVQDLYCLLLHNDVNTFGYTNWFYFSVKCTVPGIYKFAIMNYGKAGWPYNTGIGICTYNPKDKSKDWKRAGKNIQCQANSKIYTGNHSLNGFNTLSFEYQFTKQNQQVFFSYNIPYTYTELCGYLDYLQKKQVSYFYRKLAGRTLAGNRIQMLTITNFQITKHSNDIPVIILFARSHPGQTVSSWVMKYFLDFISSQDPKARLLRDNFVFKIFPMINPDGVIHGNYRCSLSGRDLNRRWNKPSKQLFPQVYYIKNNILDLAKNRPIKMIIDLHGHSQKKKVFMYGCNDKYNPHKCRLFPYMLSKVSKHFEFNFCNFSIHKSKLSTARVNLYQSLKINNVFTLQSSQYGIFNCHLTKKILSEVGQSLAQAFLLYFRPKEKSFSSTIMPQLKQFQEKGAQFQNQLNTNEELLKAGNQQDQGSQGQPSIDNIQFDKLAKMNQRKDMKIIGNIVNTKKNGVKSLNRKQNSIIQERALYKAKQKIPTKKLSVGPPARNISSSDNNRNNLRNYYKQHKQRQNIGKSSTPQVSRRNVVKMINFSLSIDDQNCQLNKFISKIPVFRNMQWKFMYDQNQSFSYYKTSEGIPNSLYKISRVKPYININDKLTYR